MIFFNLVLLVGGRQYIVIPGRLLYVQRLKGPNVNDKPNTRIRITGITGFENYPGATLESVAASSST
ncbi:50S ribosomal protein L21, chloroplastic [Linum grandiflorum]